MKKHYRYIILLLIGLSALVACRPKEEVRDKEADKGLQIVTSFYPVYQLTREIVGDLHDVQMLPTSSGIHGFEPSVTDIQTIYDADVFIYHSSILEGWVKQLTPEAENTNVHLIEASDGLDLQRVEGLEDLPITEGVDEKTLYDPHTWLDPVLVGEEALRIASALSAIDAENAAVYQKNAQKIVEQASALTARYQKRFLDIPHKTFVTQHTAFSYLARRFGLQQLGIAGIAEEEPSPRQLAEIQEFIQSHGVQVIFVEKNQADKLAKTLAKETNIRLSILDPLEIDPQNKKTFLENSAENLAVLADALEKE